MFGTVLFDMLEDALTPRPWVITISIWPKDAYLVFLARVVLRFLSVCLTVSPNVTNSPLGLSPPQNQKYENLQLKHP